MKVVVVGGGIAGLAAAYYAKKSGMDVTLIERDSRLGGKIITDTPQGFVIEGGPDSFITQKPAALQLCRELGIEDELIGTNDERRTIYILRHGKLMKMPDGLMLVVPTKFLPFAKSGLISWWGKLRMAQDLFIKPRTDDGDESLASFMRRRLGQEALDVLGEPMMAGIHVSDAETLSLKASFPRFLEIERKYGSLTRGMIAARKNQPAAKLPMFMTMKHGLQALVNTLENKLAANTLVGNGAKSIEKLGSEWVVTLDNGRKLFADAVVMATPASISSTLLQAAVPELAHLLGSIRYVSTATISLGYREADFEHPLNGFGFVIPKSEPTRLLACTWTSTKFDHRAPENHVLLRVFVGGHRHPELVALQDDELIQIVREELQTIMKISAVPQVTRVFRWPSANPQYDVGHLDKVAAMENLCPTGLYLTGSAYRGVGIPDCIQQGQQTAEKLVQQFKEMALA